MKLESMAPTMFWFSLLTHFWRIVSKAAITRGLSFHHFSLFNAWPDHPSTTAITLTKNKKAHAVTVSFTFSRARRTIKWQQKQTRRSCSPYSCDFLHCGSHQLSTPGLSPGQTQAACFPCAHEMHNLFNKLSSACRCQLYINHAPPAVSLTPL